MKNVAIGAAIGYGINDVKNLVLSFREYNVDDDLVLLVNNNNLENFVKKWNVKLFLFNRKDIPVQEIYLARLRSFGLFEFLSKSDYQNILLVDTRDLIFQGNIFADLPKEEFLYFFQEDSGILLKNESFNSNWIFNIYGKEILKQMENQHIICCGTIFGSKNPILNVLSTMKEHILKFNFGDDQGILNYIAFYSIVSHTKKQNGDIIGTIGLSISGEQKNLTAIPIDVVTFQEGLVKINNKTPSIIHQYDRSYELTKFYNEKYKIEI